MYRKHPIVANEIYHVFNRSIAGQLIFQDRHDYVRFCMVLDFYRFDNPGMRFSYYNRLEQDERSVLLDNLHKNGRKQVEIYTFCLMPTHFHFQMKELLKNGITNFISNLQNSYAKYFNVKKERTGSLFQEMFKAKRIEDDEQFIQVARYIHLNPISSFIVGRKEQLITYPWSSLRDYLQKESNFSFLSKDLLNGFYPNKELLKKFIFDQVDFQNKLREIEHILLE